MYDAAATEDLMAMTNALAFGADVSWANPGDENKTALHHACELNQVCAVEFLLQNNAKASVVDQQNRTPLDLANLKHAKEAFDLLSRKAEKGLTS